MAFSAEIEIVETNEMNLINSENAYENQPIANGNLIQDAQESENESENGYYASPNKRKMTLTNN